MKLILILALPAFIIVPSLSMADDGKMFLEIPGYYSTTTYDLRTVKMIAPEKFSVKLTTLDHPDAMQYKMRVVQALYPFCSKRPGDYHFPPQMPAFDGPPKSNAGLHVFGPENDKSLLWEYPVINMGVGTYSCRPVSHTPGIDDTEAALIHAKQRIMNGYTEIAVFDCGHYLMGTEIGDNVAPVMYPVKRGSNGEYAYAKVCEAVTGTAPYTPR